MRGRCVFILSCALAAALVLSGCGGGEAEPTASRAETLPPAAAAATSIPPTAAPAQPTPTQAASAVPTVPATAAPKATAAVPAATGAPARTPTALAANDAGSGADAPDALARALAVQAGAALSGAIAQDDAGDCYVLDLPDGSVLAVSFSPQAGAEGLSVTLYDPDESTIWSQYDLSTGTREVRYVVSGEDGGAYPLCVAGGEGPYEWEATVTPQKDGGSAGDAGAEREAGREVTLPVHFAGLVGDSDGEDWYYFEVPGGTTIALSITPAEVADLSVGLYDAEGYNPWSAYDISVSLRTVGRPYVVADEAGGEYALAVSGTGAYTVTLETTPQDDAGSGGDAPADISDAIAAPVGVAFTGLLADSDDADWYRFAVPGGTTLSVSMVPVEGDDLNVELYDAEEYNLWSAYDVSARRGGARTTCVVAEEAGGEYALEVYGTGAYTVTLEVAGQDDAGSGGDAPADLGDAIEAPVGEEFAGTLGGSDEVDWYAFDVPAGSALHVAVTSAADSEDLSVELYDPEEYDLWSAYDVGEGDTAEATLVIGPDSGGTHYLMVSSALAEYTVAITVTEQDDAGSGADAPDEISDEIALKVGETYTGLLGGSDEADWYRFTLVRGQMVTVTLEVAESEEDFYLAVYDAEENELETVYDITPRRPGRIALPEGTAGDYYIEVGEGAAEYTLTIAPGAAATG